MATDFNYANTITAGTPVAAAEVQDNFDDVLAWVKAYYQQTADTTAEIAAAVAANPGVEVLSLTETSASVSTGSITTGTRFEIPGLTATWTADATHLYRIDIEGIYWFLTSGTSQQRYWIDAGDGTTFKSVWMYHTDAAATGGYFAIGGGSCFLTGLSGSVTWRAYGLITDTVHNASLQQAGQMLVTDMGVAP